MNHINFEGLGISLNINKIAIDIGGLKIHWYAIAIVVGIALTLILCKKDNGKYNIKFEDILELAIFLFPISIICARIYFVIFKLDYYIQNPLQIFDIRSGGLAIYGGVIGAIATIYVFCKIKKIRMLDMLDYLAPYLALRSMCWQMGKFL